MAELVLQFIVLWTLVGVQGTIKPEKYGKEKDNRFEWVSVTLDMSIKALFIKMFVLCITKQLICVKKSQ